MKPVKESLFVPQFPKEKLHPNFLKILSEPLPYARNFIEQWATGFVDRDNKFIKEFQTTFNSSFWELYLFASLKELGLNVKLEYDRPDFIVESSDKSFIIEATIASHSINGKPEWEKDFSEESLREWPLEKIIDNATLRLANAFISKSQKYLKSYKNLEHVIGKPFVVAIAPFDSPFSIAQNLQAINRVLYGFDRYIAIDWDENNRDILGTIHMDKIPKNRESEVPLGYFTTPEHAHISAVIFSNTATFGKVRVMCDDPRLTLVKFLKYNEYGTQRIEAVREKSNYQEHLLDGLIVFHNPFADIPFGINEFHHPSIAHSTIDVKTKEPMVYTPDGFLYQRFINVIDIPNATPEELVEIRAILNESPGQINQKFPKFHK